MSEGSGLPLSNKGLEDFLEYRETIYGKKIAP
jgi:hypothetical protein